jgi:hypothetical protein
MWLIHQFDSFLNLGTCKEYPIMAKAKTPRTASSSSNKPTTPAETKVTAMPESKVTNTPDVKTAEPKKYAPPTPINVEEEIRRRAYELSEARGFVPGYENDDWFVAEREILTRYRQHSA